MSEMIIQETNVIKTTIKRAICPDCGTEMELNGELVRTDEFEYTCPACGFTQYTKEGYPNIILIEGDEHGNPTGNEFKTYIQRKDQV